MGVSISYMGTKRELAKDVAALVRAAKPGVFLDAFSGMCSVGEQIAMERQIWSNDAQLFAAEVAFALFVSHEAPASGLAASELAFPTFALAKDELRLLLPELLHAEAEMLATDDTNALIASYARLASIEEACRGQLADHAYSLFSTLYSNTYIGVSQAIEVDALISSFDVLRRRKKISADQRRWFLVALGRAVLKCSSTTGHFAQFMKPTERFAKVFLKQRRKSIWRTWVDSVSLLETVGDERWRSGNRVFNEDSLILLERLAGERSKPSVVYADPPYTEDQYSRFYHLLETILLYDYPAVTGIGRYRPERFRTLFSLKSQVGDAFERLASSVSAIGADLVLSYPSDGLLHETGIDLSGLLRKHFSHVECCCSIKHKHSTMGGSKGSAKADVTEHIYMATQ